MSIEEQIKNLKPGDTVLVKAKVDEVKENKVNVSHGCVSHWQHADEVYPLPTTPKYDPCRKFRKGDKVREISVKGRRFQGGHNNHKTGELASVTWNENSSSVMMQYEDGDKYLIDVAYLELVTPAEELERYVVEPGDVAWFVVDKKHESGELNVVMYMCALHPHAKEAAEAECARLNAEHRKENRHELVSQDLF